VIRPIWLFLFYAASEILISTLLRSRTKSSGTDRGSFRLIWVVISMSMLGASWTVVEMPAFVLPYKQLYWIGFVLFVFGLLLRWYSIVYLGRYFTVDVAIAADHKLIDSGPYRFIRHPAYSGAVIAFLGLALTLRHSISLVLIVVPITAVFLYRIYIEEAALRSALGPAYAAYVNRTKRLIPFVY
jgi:protein-S-isoprenylcysteine O-methyltransferase